MAALIQLAFLLLLLAFLAIIGYLLFLALTRAFRFMGFSTLEAVAILVLAFLLGSGTLDGIVGIPLSHLYLFTYNDHWQVSINAGGALLPLLLSAYLVLRHRLPLLRLGIGIAVVAAITYLVTYPDPEKGIVSQFPWWLLPVAAASVLSIILLWKQQRKAAPFAYATGTLGVLLGADVFHLLTLLSMPVSGTREAVIGGASVFDMVFITGILAVLLDSLLIIKGRSSKRDDG